MRLQALLVCTVLAGGCNTVSLVDNVDFELDFTPLIGPSDRLHSPYVQGSRMQMWVHNTDGRTRPARWTLESSDPTVFTITKQTHARDDEDFFADCEARKHGDAVITVLDERGVPLHSTVVQVRMPDRVNLLSHGLLLIGKSDDEARVPEARVRVSGTGTYLARYFFQGEQLSGNGALGVPQTTTNLVARAERTFLFEDRDWLQVSPKVAGAQLLGILVDGTRVQDVQVVGAPDADITGIRIIGEDEGRAKTDEHLVALALSNDAQQRDVYGVEYRWDLDGKAESGLGDLYRYRYRARDPHELRARFGSFSTTALIHGEGFVDSSNRLGCSAAPGSRPTASLAFAVCFVVGVLALGRRRRPNDR